MWNNGKLSSLVFRRISKRERILAIVHIDKLVGKDTPINFNQCRCPRHIGTTRVVMLPVDMYEYYSDLSISNIE